MLPLVQVTATDCETVGKFCTSGALLKFTSGVVMVLHGLSHAMEVSDWVVVIKGGQKYDEGRPEDVITARMMREVYDVDCDIITVPGREKPLIAYREIS